MSHGASGISIYRVENLFSWLRGRVGTLGWSALVVFLALRLGDLANMVNTFILGKELGKLDFGAIAPVLSAVAVLSLPVGVVFQIGVKSISRLHAIGHEDQRRALIQDLSKVAVGGAAVSILLVYSMKSFIMDRLHLDGDVYIHWVAALFVLTWIYPLLSAVLQGEHRYGVLVLPSVISGFSALFLTWLLVVVLARGLPGALFARILANTLAAVALYVVLRRSFTGARQSYREEWPVMRQMLLPMTAYAVGSAALIHFDRLFVRNFLCEQSYGYGAVVTLGAIPQYFLGALTFVFFPVASSDHARGRDLDRYRRAAALSGLAVTAGSAIFFALAGRTIMRAWNAPFEPFADALWVFAAGMGMQGLIDMLIGVEMARHRYGFLWGLVLPAIGYCGLLYWMRASINIMVVVWAGVAVRAVVLACLWQYGMGRRGRDDVSEAERVQ